MKRQKFYLITALLLFVAGLSYGLNFSRIVSLKTYIGRGSRAYSENFVAKQDIKVGEKVDISMFDIKIVGVFGQPENPLYEFDKDKNWVAARPIFKNQKIQIPDIKSVAQDTE